MLCGVKHSGCISPSVVCVVWLNVPLTWAWRCQNQQWHQSGIAYTIDFATESESSVKICHRGSTGLYTLNCQWSIKDVQKHHTNVTSLDSDCILGSGWAIWKLFNGMCRVLWLIVKTLQVWKRKIRVLRKNHLAHWLGHKLRFGFWPVQLCKSLDVNRACLHVTEHASQLGGHEAIFINTTTSMTFLFWLLWATFYSICNAEKIRRDFFLFSHPLINP